MSTSEQGAASIERKRDTEVIGLLKGVGGREFALFLGAGCSITSGIKSGEQLVREWKAEYANRPNLSAEKVEEWAAGQENEYAALFEACYDSPRRRQQYLSPIIEAAKPGWGYLYLATLVAQQNRFNVIFTTNFDDLLNKALTEFANYTAVVCAADSQVGTLDAMTDRAKVIKLHGDYLFEQLKNTKEELSALDPNMAAKFREFSSNRGLIVLGYSGGDASIMNLLEELLAEPKPFPRNVWWGVRRGVEPHARVEQLARQYPNRVRVFEFVGFDEFMADLHAALECGLPAFITEPFAAHRAEMEQLVKKAVPRENDEVIPARTYILEHSRRLRQALNVPLLQAQLALGRRDHAQAVTFATENLAAHPGDAEALTTLGDALDLEGDATADAKLKARAEKCWLEAVEADPSYFTPRQRLLRFYRVAHRFPEAIAQAEALVAASAADAMTRQMLAHLYLSTGRLREAQTGVDALLAERPSDGELWEMRGSVMQQRGFIPEAIEAYRRAVACMPRQARLHFGLASVLALVGKRDEAVGAFEQAVLLEPANVAFRLQLVNFYCGMGRPILALPHAEEAARLEPDSREALGWLGQAHMALNDAPRAWDATERALALTPDDPRLLVNAGIILDQLGRWGEAEQRLRQAVALARTLPEPYIMLCSLLHRQGRRAECNQEFMRLQQIDPQKAQVLNMQLMQMPPGGAGGPPPLPSAQTGGGAAQEIWSKLFG